MFQRNDRHRRQDLLDELACDITEQLRPGRSAVDQCHERLEEFNLDDDLITDLAIRAIALALQQYPIVIHVDPLWDERQRNDVRANKVALSLWPLFEGWNRLRHAGKRASSGRNVGGVRGKRSRPVRSVMLGEHLEVRLALAGINYPPVPVGDVGTTYEDVAKQFATATLLKNDSKGSPDEIGQSLTINGVSSSSAKGGTVILTGTSVTYAPPLNFYGTDTFVYSVIDNGTTNGVNDFKSAEGTVTVTVTQVNDRPTLDSIADVNVLEDSSKQAVTLTGISAGPNESQQMSVRAVSSNTALIPNPTVTYLSPGATASLAFTPLANQSGTAQITVTVTDNGGTANGGLNSISRVLTVTVGAVNDPPSINKIANVTLLEDDAPKSINLSGIGSGLGENQSLTITAISSNTALIGSPSVNYASPEVNGWLTVTPIANQYGTATITVTIADDGGTANGGNNTSSVVFVVSVSPVNDSPTLDPVVDLELLEDDPKQLVSLGGITAGMNESQKLSVSAVSNNAKLIPNPVITYTSPNSTASLAFTPIANQNGTAKITVTVGDNGGTANGGAATFVRSFQVTVNPVNDAPKSANRTVSTNEDVAYRFSPSDFPFIDVDSEDTLNSMKIMSLPKIGTLRLNGAPVSVNQVISSADLANMSFVPKPDVSGMPYAFFDFRVSDGSVYSGTSRLSLNVVATNDPPTFSMIGTVPIIAEGAGPQILPNFVANMAPGPATAIDEMGQTLTFDVTVKSSSDTLRFSALPSIDLLTKTLTYAVAAGTYGDADIEVRLRDSGNGDNTSAAQQFRIVVREARLIAESLIASQLAGDVAAMDATLAPLSDSETLAVLRANSILQLSLADELVSAASLMTEWSDESRSEFRLLGQRIWAARHCERVIVDHLDQFDDPIVAGVFDAEENSIALLLADVLVDLDFNHDIVTSSTAIGRALRNSWSLEHSSDQAMIRQLKERSDNLVAAADALELLTYTYDRIETTTEGRPSIVRRLPIASRRLTEALGNWNEIHDAMLSAARVSDDFLRESATAPRLFATFEKVSASITRLTVRIRSPYDESFVEIEDRTKRRQDLEFIRASFDHAGGTNETSWSTDFERRTNVGGGDFFVRLYTDATKTHFLGSIAGWYSPDSNEGSLDRQSPWETLGSTLFVPLPNLAGNARVQSWRGVLNELPVLEMQNGAMLSRGSATTIDLSESGKLIDRVKIRVQAESSGTPVQVNFYRGSTPIGTSQAVDASTVEFNDGGGITSVLLVTDINQKLIIESLEVLGTSLVDQVHVPPIGLANNGDLSRAAHFAWNQSDETLRRGPSPGYTALGRFAPNAYGITRDINQYSAVTILGLDGPVIPTNLARHVLGGDVPLEAGFWEIIDNTVILRPGAPEQIVIYLGTPDWQDPQGRKIIVNQIQKMTPDGLLPPETMSIRTDILAIRNPNVSEFIGPAITEIKDLGRPVTIGEGNVLLTVWNDGRQGGQVRLILNPDTPQSREIPFPIGAGEARSVSAKFSVPADGQLHIRVVLPDGSAVENGKVLKTRGDSDERRVAIKQTDGTYSLRWVAMNSPLPVVSEAPDYDSGFAAWKQEKVLQGKIEFADPEKFDAVFVNYLQDELHSERTPLNRERQAVADRLKIEDIGGAATLAFTLNQALAWYDSSRSVPGDLDNTISANTMVGRLILGTAQKLWLEHDASIRREIADTVAIMTGVDPAYLLAVPNTESAKIEAFADVIRRAFNNAGFKFVTGSRALESAGGMTVDTDRNSYRGGFMKVVWDAPIDDRKLHHVGVCAYRDDNDEKINVQPLGGEVRDRFFQYVEVNPIARAALSVDSNSGAQVKIKAVGWYSGEDGEATPLNPSFDYLDQPILVEQYVGQPIVAPFAGAIEDLAVNVDDKVRRRKENVILSLLRDSFPLDAPKSYTWGIGSRYHIGVQDFAAADLGRGEDYKTLIYAVAKGTIRIDDNAENYGTVVVEYPIYKADGSFDFTWKLKILHTPIYKTGESDPESGKPIYVMRTGNKTLVDGKWWATDLTDFAYESSDGSSTVLRLFDGMSVEPRQPIAVIAGRGTRFADINENNVVDPGEADFAFGDHIHFLPILDGIGVDMTKLLTWKLGIRTSADDISVTWDPNLKMLVNDTWHVAMNREGQRQAKTLDDPVNAVSWNVIYQSDGGSTTGGRVVWKTLKFMNSDGVIVTQGSWFDETNDDRRWNSDIQAFVDRLSGNRL